MAKRPGRERLSLDRNWRFARGHGADPSKDFDFVRDRSLVKAGEARGAASPSFDDSVWRVIDVPHDWAIELPYAPADDREICEHGFHAIGPDHPQNSVGWYRRAFEIPKDDDGRRLTVEFDGVFRDSIAWLNGHRLGRHASGYTPIRYDITDIANYGGRNVLVVRADASNWEGWWYEGAGIYRHVWLVKTPPLHVAHDGTFVTSEARGGRARVALRTTVVNESEGAAEFALASIVEEMNGKQVATAMTRTLRLDPWDQREIVQRIEVAKPKLWSCDEPNLYQVRTTLNSPVAGARGYRRPLMSRNKTPVLPQRGYRTVDEHITAFGIRTIRWDA
jgi:beta-galactosidase